MIKQEQIPLLLIVDDLLMNREMIKISLQGERYLFLEASNGKEAIEMAKKYQPDVILMDAIMPVLNGYEATKAIKEIEYLKRTPILMITALNEKEDKIKAISYGVSDFISKPFDTTELQVRCHSYVELSQLNKKYILANKDKDTNLPNKVALLCDIELLENPQLVLFKIKDYALLESFYSIEIVQKIKEVFIKRFENLLPILFQLSQRYSVSDDDFALLLESDATKEMMYESCHLFYQAVKDEIIAFDDNRYNVDIVIGFAQGKENLYTHARVGLNQAIAKKKDVVYANEILQQTNQEIIKNIQTVEMIKNALEDDKIISYFQPIHDNKTKEIYKYESLVRLIDKDEKVISPFFFLDIAKKSSYYLDITNRVLQNSFKMLQEKNIEISINISSIEIENESTKGIIFDFLHANPKYAKKITFELLEDENIEDFESMKKFIADVKKCGAKIAIDDFGAGYSSFERLLEFQPDFLKIDGSLIKNIQHSAFSRTIVETIQDFANKMQIKTVAEFVSNEEIFNIINEIGIDYTQGYFIDEPRATIKGE